MTQALKPGTQAVLSAAFTLCSMAYTPLHAQQVQMNLTQGPGCTFSNQQSGTLGISADWRTLSTEISEGRRPSVRILNTGQVTLTTQNDVLWTHNNASISMSNSLVFLRDQPTLGKAINLPLLLTTPGYRDVYLEATATSPTNGLSAGIYKIGITLSCL